MIENGILNINKPQGMTSHDVVYRVRRALGIKRVGHTGTLDPMCTGVLPICIGTATRVTEYLDLDFKTYRCSMILGKITDTQDIWGELLEERPLDGITEEDVRNAFGSFSGVIMQKPPMYSAVRVNGRRLYEYARAGEEVKVKERKIYINSLEIEKIDLAEKMVVFNVECSKGTYIRTICQDVGLALGCGAVMSALERLASGAFKIEEALNLDDLMNMSPEEIEKHMKSADFPLIHFGKVVCDAAIAKKFVDGHHLPLNECEKLKEPEFKDKDFVLDMREDYKGAYNVYKGTEAGNLFLGVAFYSRKYKKLVADKVLSRGE